MSENVDVTALLRRFAEFTKGLSPDLLARVATGDLKIGITNLPDIKVDAKYISVQLEKLSSREVAAALIDDLKLKLPELRELARALGASIVGAGTKAAVRDRIVDHKVGHRLDSRTIRQGSWVDG